MKRQVLSMCVLALALALGGCTGIRSLMPAPAAQAPAPAPARAPALTAADGAPIEKVPFRLGVSSATVEHMAHDQACTGGLGAGLITQSGPIEVYRMQCDNGKVFMARCELRQCRKM